MKNSTGRRSFQFFPKQRQKLVQLHSGPVSMVPVREVNCDELISAEDDQSAARFKRKSFTARIKPRSMQASQCQYRVLNR